MKHPERIFKRIALLLLIVILFSAFYLVFYNLLSMHRVFTKIDTVENIKDYLYNFLPILVLTLCNIAIVFRMWRNTVIERHLPVKIAADLVVSFTVLYAVNKLYVVIALASHLNPRVDWVGTVLCNILLLMGVEIVYYIKRSREALQRVEEAKRQSLQYRYDALKAQVNPHFLFNALNMQVSLISADPARAIDYTSELSNVYRYILAIQNKTLISLSEELNFLESYLSILKIRYNDNFVVDVIYEDDVEGKYIIPYTLQLLAENVTKHNVISAKYPMTLTVRISRDHLEVSNPVNYKENTTSTGVGLRYIAQQYVINGKRIHIENDEQTFTAIIPYL